MHSLYGMLAPRRLALIASASVLLALALAAASASDGQQMVNFRVEEAKLKLVIHPDGSVQPIYHLRALVELPREAMIKLRKLEATAVYNSVFKKDQSSSELTGRLHVESDEDMGEGGKLKVVLKSSYSFEKGIGAATLSGYAELVDREKHETKRYTLERLVLESNEKGKIVVSLSLIVPRDVVSDMEGGKAPTPDEINQQLRASGIDYITVEELGASLIAGGRAKVTARATIDLARMLDRLVASGGLTREEADKLMKLLYSDYRIEGSSDLNLDFNVYRGYISADIAYKSTARGDVARFEEINAEMTPLIQKVAAALAATMSRENPQVAVAVSQLTTSTGPAFTVVPPSESHASFRAVKTDKGVEVSLDYTGARLVLAGLEDAPPSEKAARTLTALADTIDQLTQLVGMLGIYVPGLSAAIPPRIELEPASPSVKVSAASVTPGQLRSVRVEIKGAPGQATATASPAETKTARATGTTETTTTTTATTTAATGATGATGTAVATTSPAAATTGTATKAATTTTAGAGAAATGTQAGPRGGGATTAVIAVAVVVAAAAAAAVLLRRS